MCRYKLWEKVSIQTNACALFETGTVETAILWSDRAQWNPDQAFSNQFSISFGDLNSSRIVGNDYRAKHGCLIWFLKRHLSTGYIIALDDSCWTNSLQSRAHQYVHVLWWWRLKNTEQNRLWGIFSLGQLDRCNFIINYAVYNFI